MTLKFTRTEPGRYHAKGAAHIYLVQRLGKVWTLTISTKKTVAGVDVSDRQVHRRVDETKALCAAVAEEFEALGEGYRSGEHGHRERHTEAGLRAYAR